MIVVTACFVVVIVFVGFVVVVVVVGFVFWCMGRLVLFFSLN